MKTVMVVSPDWGLIHCTPPATTLPFRQTDLPDRTCNLAPERKRLPRVRRHDVTRPTTRSAVSNYVMSKTVTFALKIAQEFSNGVQTPVLG
jgi:hypothetical protein